jgi:hypothetical protein
MKNETKEERDERRSRRAKYGLVLGLAFLTTLFCLVAAATLKMSSENVTHPNFTAVMMGIGLCAVILFCIFSQVADYREATGQDS